MNLALVALLLSAFLLALYDLSNPEGSVLEAWITGRATK